MKIPLFLTIIVLSKRWKLCQTITQWQPWRVEGVFNQIRCLSHTALQQRRTKAEWNGEPISLAWLNYPYRQFSSGGWSLLSSRPSQSVGFPLQ